MRNLLGTENFTGWHMAAVMALFFGTIISVNLTLAYHATQSWTGLVVKNSYVASQDFNETQAELMGHKHLKWKEIFEYSAGKLRVSLTQENGTPIPLDSLTAKVGRPVHEHEDRIISFTRIGIGQFTSNMPLAPGLWEISLIATRNGETVWTARHRLEGGQN